MAHYRVGWDPAGAGADWSAVSIAELIHRDVLKTFGPTIQPEIHSEELWRVVELRRFKGVSFVVQLAEIVELMRTRPIAGCAQLVLDATGLGGPLADLADDCYRRGELDNWPEPITITGGDADSETRLHIPKANLSARLEVLLAEDRLHINDALPLAPALKAEMLAFSAKLSASGRARFEAAGSEHDDLVLSTMLACYQARPLRGQPRRMNLQGHVYAGEFPVIEVTGWG